MLKLLETRYLLASVSHGGSVILGKYEQFEDGLRDVDPMPPCMFLSVLSIDGNFIVFLL